MRPPARRTALSAAAVAALTLPRSRMHAMVGGVGRLDRQEGAGPDMQGHPVERDAARLRARATSSGVKCRPAVGAATAPSSQREHGLVVVAVALVGRAPRRDIGRQRHVAALRERLIEHRAMEREGERHLAALAFFLDRGVELAEEAHLALGCRTARRRPAPGACRA